MNAKLFIGSYEFYLLSYTNPMFYPSPDDKMFYRKEDILKEKDPISVFGSQRKYECWNFNLLEGFDQTSESCRAYLPRTNLLGGIFSVSLEAQRNDETFKQYLTAKTENGGFPLFHGKIEIYESGDENILRQRIEFYDGFICDFKLDYSDVPNSLLFHLRISAATLLINGNKVFQRSWYKTPIELQVYKNYNQAIEEEKEQEKKFYYKGTKKWGQMQDGFTRKYASIRIEGDTIIIPDELAKNLTEEGRKNLIAYSKKSLKEIKEIYEGLTPLEQASVLSSPITTIIYREKLTGVRAVVSKENADKIINYFYHGKGKKLSFGPETKISQDLKGYDYFQDWHQGAFLKVIKYMIQEGLLETKDGEDIANIFSNMSKSMRPNFSRKKDIISYDYYGIFGGTQTIKVDLEVQELDNKQYKVKTRMYIGDWYGADADDINDQGVKKIADSLKAFFYLQHFYGYQPFETEIIYESIDYIQL